MLATWITPFHRCKTSPFKSNSRRYITWELRTAVRDDPLSTHQGYSFDVSVIGRRHASRVHYIRRIHRLSDRIEACWLVCDCQSGMVPTLFEVLGWVINNPDDLMLHVLSLAAISSRFQHHSESHGSAEGWQIDRLFLARIPHLRGPVRKCGAAAVHSTADGARGKALSSRAVVVFCGAILIYGVQLSSISISPWPASPLGKAPW